jgi:hypothetical protein
LALPASFRPRLEPRCFLSIGRDKCVDILTSEAFEAAARESMEKVRNGEMSLNQQRAQASTPLKLPLTLRDASTSKKSCANMPASR